jgi:methylmalonyl-CoA/ethylmalonyl-CoA epimerase
MATTTEALALGSIGQIALTVQDVPRSVEFYRDQLGLRQLPIPAPPTLAFFDCDGIRLMLSVPEGDIKPGGGTVIYFKVNEIRAAFEDLKGRGVPFMDEPHLIARLPHAELWMTFFRDPDGHILAIMSEQKG